MHGPVDGEVSRSSRSSPSIAPTLPRRADPDRPLLQGFRVRLRVEPDEQRPANPERRRPEGAGGRSEEHTSELQSPCNLVCRLLLEKKKTHICACWPMAE